LPVFPSEDEENRQISQDYVRKIGTRHVTKSAPPPKAAYGTTPSL
jgi:hypothetical protein